MSVADRDELLYRKRLIRAYKRDKEHFRKRAEQAFSEATRMLEEAAALLNRPRDTLLPQSQDCAILLAGILGNDPRWTKICLTNLGHNMGQFVRQITQLMAEYLIDTYWATLIVRR